MKKILSSLVLASAVMVGLFSSCVPEDIETTFETKPATATITVTVLEGETLSDITASSTITAASSLLGANVVVNGNQVVLTGNKPIVAQTINVTATASIEGVSKSSPTASVAILPCRAGGVSTYAVTLIITPAGHSYSYEWTKREDKGTTPAQFIPKGKSIDIDGHNWSSNESQYLLHTSVKYDDYHGIEGGSHSVVAGTTKEDASNVKMFADGLAKKNVYRVPSYIEIGISAFSIYTVFADHVRYTDFYDILRENDETHVKTKVGEVQVNSVATVAWYEEKALPGHEGHYEEGHGHSDVHGYSSNAGGGIFFAE